MVTKLLTWNEKALYGYGLIYLLIYLSTYLFTYLVIKSSIDIYVIYVIYSTINFYLQNNK